MRVTELRSRAESIPSEALSYDLYLAMPDHADGDDVDLQEVQIGEVRLEEDKNEIVLIPASADWCPESSGPYTNLMELLGQLPSGLLEENNCRILVELPLARQGVSDLQLTFTDIFSLHVRDEIGEVWMLLRPESEFSPDELAG